MKQNNSQMLYIQEENQNKGLHLLVLLGVSRPLLQIAWSHGRMCPAAGAHSHHHPAT